MWRLRFFFLLPFLALSAYSSLNAQESTSSSLAKIVQIHQAQIEELKGKISALTSSLQEVSQRTSAAENAAAAAQDTANSARTVADQGLALARAADDAAAQCLRGVAQVTNRLDSTVPLYGYWNQPGITLAAMITVLLKACVASRAMDILLPCPKPLVAQRQLMFASALRSDF